MAWGRSRRAAWTDADSALWETCRILTSIKAGAVEPISNNVALAAGESALAKGTVRVDEFRAAGNGVYSRSGVVAMGRPGLVAGILLINSASNASARRKAQADAQVRWRHAFHGHLIATTHGFVLHTADGVFRWDWASIDSVRLDGRAQLVMQGRSQRGSISWRLNTLWAELLLCSWAIAYKQQHPQAKVASILPAGWIEHAQSHGHPPALGWDADSLPV